MRGPPCICDGTTYTVLIDGTHRRLGEERDFTIARCLRCGLARTLPAPDASQYVAGYSHSTEAGKFVQREDDVWSRPRAEWIRRYAPGANTLLDVGCNDGELVTAAIDQGFWAEGIDVDPLATAWAREQGRPVMTGEVSELQRVYDVVVTAHTVEHVADPLAFLRDCGAHLAPRGRLFVFTPNRKSLLARLMRENWMLWAPAEHVWHYTPTTLTNIARGASLFPERVAAKGVLEPRSSGVKGAVKDAARALAPLVGAGDQIEAIYTH